MFRLVVAFVFVLGLAGCGQSQEPVMPDVVGRRLDVALSDIERAGVKDEVEILGGGLFGVFDKSKWQVCEQTPPVGQAVTTSPRLTVDRSCGAQPSGEPTQEPEPRTSETAPRPDTYTYRGPKYEVVTVDESVGVTELDQHWVYVDELKGSRDAVKEQARAIITDVARTENTAKLIVQVVTDREIIEAESVATIERFMKKHGADYWKKVMVPKEKSHWIAWYQGGFDSDAGEPSDDASTFGIDWWPAGTSMHEKWKPRTTG